MSHWPSQVAVRAMHSPAGRTSRANRIAIGQSVMFLERLESSQQPNGWQFDKTEFSLANYETFSGSPVRGPLSSDATTD